MKKSLLKIEDLKKQKYSWVRLVLVSVLILVLLGMGLYKAKNGDVWKLSLQLLTGLFLIEYGFSNYKRQKQHDKSTAIVDELIEDADEKLNQLRDSLPSTFELKRILMKRSWREGRFVEDFYKTQMPEERKKAYEEAEKYYGCDVQEKYLVGNAFLPKDGCNSLYRTMSLLRNQASELVSFGRSIFLVDMGLYDNPLRPKEELELELKKLEKMEMDLLKVMFFLKEKLSEARINNFDLRQLEEHISNMSK